MHDEIRARVDQFLVTLAASEVASHVEAVVVGGSAARGEEMWRDGVLLSDIDLLVVTRSERTGLARRIGELISRHHDAGVDGGRIPLRALRSYATLSFYEARLTGVTVHGSERAIESVPMTSPAQIPVWEATRVLGNRLLEHVKVLVGRRDADEASAKTYESIGEAQLVIDRAYAPTYAERADRLVHRAAEAGQPLVDDLGAKAAAAYAFRSAGVRELPSLEEARGDVQLALRTVLAAELGHEGPLDSQLAMLGIRERNPVHTLLWTAHLARTTPGRIREVRLSHPLSAVWREALSCIAGEREDARRVLDDWAACPQIYRGVVAA